MIKDWYRCVPIGYIDRPHDVKFDGPRFLVF